MRLPWPDSRSPAPRTGRTRFAAIILSGLLGTLAAAPLSGQALPPALQKLKTRQHIRVESTRAIHEGRFTSLARDTLVLESRGGSQLIPLTDIERLSVRSHAHGSGALIGAGAGAVLGIAVGFVLSDVSYDSTHWIGGVALVGAFFAGVGGAMGFGVGSFIHRWSVRYTGDAAVAFSLPAP